MTAEQIAEIIKDRFPDQVVDARFSTAHPHIAVRPERWHEVAQFLKTDSRLKLDVLRCMSAVDMIEDKRFDVVFDLYSTIGTPHSNENWSARHAFCVKVRVPREQPHLASVADVWPAADWHEREAYDLMGVVFDNHPDSVDDADGHHPRRILCADDWVGHPLRKDYVFPMEYHDIPAVTEHGQTRPVH